MLYQKKLVHEFKVEMISHENKCIFIHIPKCAGTSIENALGHFEGNVGRGFQDHRTIRMLEAPLLNPHIFSSRENVRTALRRMKSKLHLQTNPRNKFTVNKKQYEEYFKFTFVRNPWARAYSWYENVMRSDAHKKNLNIVNELSFEDFLMRFSGKGALREQTYWITNFGGKIPLDFIGRFENLSEDFSKICELMDLESIDLPHNIRGSGSNYQEKYSRRAKEIVSSYYQTEIALFDYKFED
jgi:hypothetical protein